MAPTATGWWYFRSEFSLVEKLFYGIIFTLIGVGIGALFSVSGAYFDISMRGERRCIIMQYLIMRHGDYDIKGNLTDGGRKKITTTVENALTQIKATNALVCASTSSWAVQSGEIAAIALGSVGVSAKVAEPIGALLSYDDYLKNGQVEDAKNAVDQQSAAGNYDLVVIVSHYELTPFLVAAYKKNVENDRRPRFGDIGKGEGVAVFENGKARNCYYL
jgi:hypothetical protein